MLSHDHSASRQTADGRKARGQAILQSFRTDAEGVLGRMADALADLPDNKAFEQVEHGRARLPRHQALQVATRLESQNHGTLGDGSTQVSPFVSLN